MRISTILFVVGALALIVGIAIVGFGIPVSEFSFGNTLIIAGATTATGGLIIMALGAVAVQLQRLNETLAHAPLTVAAPEAYEAAMPAAEEQPHPFEPRGPSEPPEFPMPASPAPSLRNPEEPVEFASEEAAAPAAEPVAKEPRSLPSWMRQRPAAPTGEVNEEPKSSFFDSVWPPESKMFGRTEQEEAAAEPLESEPEQQAAEVEPAEPEVAAPEEKPRAIAILKSGVVDGMGYTLYVDGSIEAELPQGTLRFASIHELRAHLEQNG